MRHKNIGAITNNDHIRKMSHPWRMPMLSIVLLCLFSTASWVRADPYEVLVIAVADPNDKIRIAEFEKDAANFNALNRRGYSSARPYFNLLHMADGQVYFVFGFRDQVQGIHRRNYPKTIENLRRLKHDGMPKYPHMHWLPVEDIRRLLVGS